MTEAEWLNGADWRPMLPHLAGTASARKWRLYVCAGLRCIWDLLYDDSSREAIEVGERAADGAATADEVKDAKYCAECPTFGSDFEAEWVVRCRARGYDDSSVRRLMGMGVYTEADVQRGGQLGDPAVVASLLNAACIAERLLLDIDEHGLGSWLVDYLAKQAAWPGGWLVREVFGNPFRPAIVTPAWRTATVMNLAGRAYDERAYHLLPYLGDALEDAGCDATDLLAHVRGPGPHARGCWALDRVLGKEP